MRAARLNRFGRPPSLEQVPVPAPGSGESLVQIEAASLSHLDLTIAGGRFGVRPTLPHTGGTQGVGRVLISERFTPGQRVRVRGQGVGVTRPGCWSEYVVVPDAALVSEADELTPALAAAFPQPATTAHAAVHDVARIQPGERVLVTGASGAVGQLAGQLALRVGAHVRGLVSTRAKAALLPVGVEPIVAEFGVPAVEQKVDVVVDTVGGTVLAEVLASSVAPRGRAVLLGYTAGERFSLDLPSWLLSEVALLPLTMMRRSARSAEVLPELSSLLASGDLSFHVDELPFAELASGLERLAAGRVTGRAVVTFSQEAPL